MAINPSVGIVDLDNFTSKCCLNIGRVAINPLVGISVIEARPFGKTTNQQDQPPDRASILW